VQAVILKPPELERPPVTKPPNDRLQDVEQKIKRSEETTKVFDGRMGAIERNSAALFEKLTSLSGLVHKSRSGPNPWAPLVITALGVLGTLFTLAYNIKKVDKLNTSISGEHGLSTREAKLETSLRLLTAVIAPQLVHEMDKALDESAKAASDGQIGTASAILGRIAEQANALRQAGIGADQSFFSNAASTLSTIAPGDAQTTNPAWVALADYHSAVVHPKNLASIFAPGSNQAVTTDDLANLPRDHDSYVNGFKVFRAAVTPYPLLPGLRLFGDGGEIIFNTAGGDLLSPAGGGVRGGVRLIDGLVVVTPSQTLDGIVWENVVFVNARIRYLGGPVTLRNVRFVNCTFDLPAKVGRPILNYALAQELELILPGSKASAGF
jgi:hypothetical protein